MAAQKKPSSARLGAIAIAASLLLLAGCTSGGSTDEPTKDSDLAVAQADLAKKQEALDAAKKAEGAASETFCSSASSYITAIDRYGDVLDQSTVTVGDVKTGGADLKEPSSETQDAAKAVVSAREDVATAEQDVADAEAAVAAAQAAESGTPAPEVVKASPSPTPTIPAATVDRVKQAETDFQSAQSGITDDTPLAKATEQFNSAAVALEMAWIQLFAQSGCLTDSRQAEASNAIRDYTLAIQQSLADAGYYTGKVDGIYGPLTVEAVVALQAANELPQTGTVDKATDAALRKELEAKGAAAAAEQSLATAALQQTLKLAGYWDKPVDGQWSDELTAAVAAAQTDLGVPATGTVDAVTLAAFQAKLASVLEPSAFPSPEPEPTASS
ncbi:peptidoglycan-binding protein [Cellulomonas sp. URHD0024]|uniref:peptidoglycan-binding domain-containing protein n=1 Tax=Cellulomonas sp. URHD0024 TaxID=1302620 RepID=UPI00041D4655|nr:peptidoglycan-binding domain-containing protein [Cellulomonas sp. URHD0024]